MPHPPTDRHSLVERFRSVRQRTEQLCEPLKIEDYSLQSMPDCSPPKWHLAHTAWFFETFVLADHLPGYQPFHSQFTFLFNSYYEGVGSRWPRATRGLLSRPTVADVYAYRHFVDQHTAKLLETAAEPTLDVICPLIEIGLHHEQQHQELLLTDLKHAFALNPLHPVYALSTSDATAAQKLNWVTREPDVRWIGHAGDGFAFDIEGPRHRVFVDGFQLASRPVTVGEYLAFIEDGGYEQPQWWLSDGWTARQQQGWTAPLYWERIDDHWSVFTLQGQRPLELVEPVCHVAYYEADAYARWANARLPTEAEWEVVVSETASDGKSFNTDRFHPSIRGAFHGDVWEWTASPYTAYPGYRPAAGAIGEYNGKFMCNQMVLRGGSCITPPGHVRPTYRNFFPPDARWQFSGIRLARDLPS